MKFAFNPTFIFLLLFFWLQFAIGTSIKKPILEVTKQESSINFEEDFVRLFNLGHGRFIGTLTWMITLLEGDIEHYNKKDSNSWMFHRFKNISILDPLFYENYLFGGQYLSVIKDDISGASFIYDKGLDHYKEDFWLNFNAGFHFYFEAKDHKRAIKSYERIANHPLTKTRLPNLPSILAKLKAEEGDFVSAYYELEFSYNQLSENNPLKKHFGNTLYSIKAKIDLKCLNSNKTDCSYLDFDGIPYKKQKGLYRSNRDLKKLQLTRKKN